MASPNKPRVLIADDNVQLLALLRSILQSAGYEVTACEGGEQAIEHGRASSFDVLLLDAMMPEVDGFDVCEAIRASGPNRETPVVFLTGMVDASTYEDAVEAGADEILSKPINRSSLLLRLRSLRRLSAAREERDRRNAELRATRREQTELTELLLADLDAPLNTIHARASLLQRSIALPTDLHAPVAELAEAGRSLEEIARMLMDMLRNSEGKFVAYGEDVDLPTLVDEVCEELKEHTLGRPPVLELTVDPSLRSQPTQLDRALVRRALLRLMEGGIRAMEPGGVLRVSVQRIDGGVSLTVQDDGPPLSVDDRERIDTFEDSPSLTGRLPRSRGLGLVFCRVVAEAHGGSVEVASAPDNGTAVSLRLIERL